MTLGDVGHPLCMMTFNNVPGSEIHLGFAAAKGPTELILVHAPGHYVREQELACISKTVV